MVVAVAWQGLFFAQQKTLTPRAFLGVAERQKTLKQHEQTLKSIKKPSAPPTPAHFTPDPIPLTRPRLPGKHGVRATRTHTTAQVAHAHGLPDVAKPPRCVGQTPHTYGLAIPPIGPHMRARPRPAPHHDELPHQCNAMAVATGRAEGGN